MSISKKRKKVVVVGTGMGGAASAALFSKDYDVTVLERNAMVGGKTAMTKKDGFTVDIAVHVSARGENGPLAEVADLTGSKIEFIKPNPVATIFYDGRQGKFHPSVRPTDLLNILRVLRPSVLSLPGTAKLLAFLLYKVKSLKDVERYRSISAEDFLLGYTKDKDLGAFFEAVAGLMFVGSARKSSAAEFLVALADWFRADAVSYPKGGFGDIINSYLATAVKNKACVKVNEGATQIVVEKGSTIGVKTEKNFYPADIVLCNAGLKKTIDLTGREHFPRNYVAECGALEDSFGAIVIQYSLDHQLLRTTAGLYLPKRFDMNEMIRQQKAGEITKDNLLYLVSPTNVDPSLAPRGKHILLAGGIVPETCRDKAFNDAMLEQYEAQLNQLFPGFSARVQWRAKRTIQFFESISGRDNGNAIGAGQYKMQSGGVRSTPKTPIPGLFVVGADTGNVGIGTELAAQSALSAYALVRQSSLDRAANKEKQNQTSAAEFLTN